MNTNIEKTKTYGLKIPEKIYEELYSKADILYFLINNEETVVSCNATALEVLDYERKEISGKKFLKLVDDLYSDEIKKAIKRCKSKGYLKDATACLKNKDGRCIPVIINGLSVTDASGNVTEVRLYIKNVTDVIQLQTRQKLSTRFLELFNGNYSFEKLLENVLIEIQTGIGADGIGLFLEDKTGTKFTLGKWNKLASIPESDADDFRKWSAERWQQISDGCSLNTLCSVTTSGSLLIDSLSNLMVGLSSEEEKDDLVALADYESLGIISIKTDRFKHGYLVITHILSNRWSLDSIEFLESVLPFVLRRKENPVPVSITNTDPLNLLLKISILGILFVKDGIIQSVNKWVENFLELPSDLINGRPVTDFIASEFHERIGNSHSEGATEGSKRNCEMTVITKDGKRRWIESNQFSLGNDQMSIWCWISKEERERLHEQLIQARKMESLGILTGGIVHEFNNMLASILGYSSLLNEDIPKNSPYYNDILQIMRTSEKATELTSRLLAYAQAGGDSVSCLNMNQLVKEVAGILSRTLSRTITIRAELNSELATIMGDAGQIQHAILEVALNARDAILNEGKIVFRTSNIQLDESNVQLHSGAKAGQYVQLTISDSGIGMNSEIKEQIFDPYFTTKPKDTGKGLGLSIVQDIIEKHGGFISVFSEKDKGTVFKVHLPICDNQKRSQQKISATNTRPTLGKETILLVDNEKALKETARKMLTRYGYKVICAESGPEAIAMYKKYKNRVDLVILDLIMSGMEISKILVWLKKLNPRIKIIAAAGLGEKEAYGRAITSHISGIIHKPYQLRSLLQQVRTVLNG